MSNQQDYFNEKQKGKYQQGSGSQYHKEHASHVPDYGANNTDPNAKRVK
ncbi:hypothetical protein JMM81_04290 [Bacillus sp. V3B]|nr:hypothetical protein [Bacillus sp. V3B]MCQ6274200.1 hypothetical protein [Bacillus sp. V3B]